MVFDRVVEVAAIVPLDLMKVVTQPCNACVVLRHFQQELISHGLGIMPLVTVVCNVFFQAPADLQSFGDHSVDLIGPVLVISPHPQQGLAQVAAFSCFRLKLREWTTFVFDHLGRQVAQCGCD